MAFGEHNTKQAEGVAGQYLPDQCDVRRAYNDEGSALRIGTFVVALTTNEREGVEAPDAQTELCQGVIAYVPEDINAGDNSIADQDLCHIVTKGPVLCLMDAGEAPAVGDSVWVRVTVEGADTVLGTVRTDEDTDKAGLLTNAQFLSEAVTDADGNTCAWVNLQGVLQLSNP